MIATIKSTLITKNFSPEYYPTEIYTRLTNVSTMISESLDEFLLHNYTNALKSIIEINNHLNEIYWYTTNLPDYFIPLINFDNINKSEIDYGDNIKVSGSVVSFESPSIVIPTLFKNYSPIIELTIHEDFLYESTFTSTFSSTLLDTNDNELIISIYLFDGVMNYFYTIRFFLFQIRVSIISPFTNMHLDLTYSSTLRVSGKYYSVSNNSKLKTLYGSYWYVEDHDNENSTYWIDINKTSGDDWDFQANLSYFNNGDNLIKVSIYNTNSSYTETIRLTIFGLPESYPYQTNTSILSSIPITYSTLPLSSREFPYTWFFLIGLVILLPATVGIRSYLNNRARSRIMEKKFDIPYVPRKQLDDLKKTVQRKDQILKDISRNKLGREKEIANKKFKIKRRRH